MHRQWVYICFHYFLFQWITKTIYYWFLCFIGPFNLLLSILLNIFAQSLIFFSVDFYFSSLCTTRYPASFGVPIFFFKISIHNCNYFISLIRIWPSSGICLSFSLHRNFLTVWFLYFASIFISAPLQQYTHFSCPNEFNWIQISRLLFGTRFCLHSKFY